MRNDHGGIRGAGQGQPEVIDGQQLSKVVRAWVVRYLAERPMLSYDFRAAHTFVGPMQWLAQETGLNVRRVSGIANGEFANVSLEQADKILTAMGKTHLLVNGEIEVKRNPNWSPEAWAEYMRGRGCV